MADYSAFSKLKPVKFTKARALRLMKEVQRRLDTDPLYQSFRHSGRDPFCGGPSWECPVGSSPRNR